jgi:hypothetical protein
MPVCCIRRGFRDLILLNRGKQNIITFFLSRCNCALILFLINRRCFFNSFGSVDSVSSGSPSFIVVGLNEFCCFSSLILGIELVVPKVETPKSAGVSVQIHKLRKVVGWKGVANEH